MFNYELAKQVRDAGFPLKGFCGNSKRGEKSEYIFEPTLSEIMKELPDHSGLQMDDWGWCIYFKGTLQQRTIAETPEEAAIKYWLIVNTGKI